MQDPHPSPWFPLSLALDLQVGVYAESELSVFGGFHGDPQAPIKYKALHPIDPNPYSFQSEALVDKYPAPHGQAVVILMTTRSLPQGLGMGVFWESTLLMHDSISTLEPDFEALMLPASGAPLA